MEETKEFKMANIIKHNGTNLENKLNKEIIKM